MIEYAEHKAEFTAQRGLLDELFPFIYVASKRMSLRAICRWLEETHRIQISVNAVAKAMRNKEKYWDQLVEAIEPAARIMATAHEVHPYQILDNFDIFKELEASMPSVVTENLETEDIEKELHQVSKAAGVIRNRWFSLPEDVRDQCRRHFVRVFFDGQEPEGEGNE